MWPWNDLDLDDIDSVYDFDLIHVNQSQTDVQVAKSAFPISDHYLDLMALMLKLNLDTVKIYHHTKN